ncbi:MAG: trypsin-like peptidase domain-containing protein [Thermodesulfobacteriota bacterium]
MKKISLMAINIMVLFSTGCYVSSVYNAKRDADSNATGKLVSCTYISSYENFCQCLSQAESGDAEAAFGVAGIYERGKYFSSYSSGGQSFSIERDKRTAIQWYKKAADLGHKEALKKVYNGYKYGTNMPQNFSEAERYLIKASNFGCEWAMLEVAKQAEDGNPEKALELYFKLASKNNCLAQRRLSELYIEGDIVPQDLCKSYFWLLLVLVDQYERCGGFGSSSYSKVLIDKNLTPKDIELVQNAASNWQLGQMPPTLPLVQAEQKKAPSPIKVEQPNLIRVSKVKHKPIEWSPVEIELSMQLKRNLTSTGLYNLVNPSIWVVVSATTSENLNAMNNISLGSAVAISKNMLLTNYHVIKKRPYVIIRHGDLISQASIYVGDKETDRCVLLVKNIELEPVKGFREYDTLAVGESVYSVGSPQGLENSLGQGIVSGKRELGRQKIIQTTAHISPGSSGGGLFDSSGNLIGITTFKISDSEGLNFAIPIESFTRQ